MNFQLPLICICLARISLFSVLCMSSLQAHAAWPDRPIRIIVPYAAGAAGDLALRNMLPALQMRLGQPVIVDNKAGAGGNIGTHEVVRAKPDGYTLLLGAANNFVINQFMYKSLGFDPLSALTPITKVIDVPSVIFINATLPVRTYRELEQYAKKLPDKLNFGSPGSGTTPHLTGLALSQAIGAQFVHVPYKGSQPGIVGLLGNDVQLYIAGYGLAGAHLASGRIRALAVISPERLKAAPDLPTAVEAGVPTGLLGNWWGLAAPKGCDPRIVARLGKEFKAVLSQPSTQEYLATQGFIASGSTSDEFLREWTSEAIQWQAFVQKSGAQVD